MKEKETWGHVSLPGELSSIWPKSDNGAYVKPVFLAHCLCVDMDDELLISMLRGYGIPAMRVSPGDGSFGKVILGMSGTGTDIYVPESLYEDAKALMEAEPDEQL